MRTLNRRRTADVPDGKTHATRRIAVSPAGRRFSDETISTFRERMSSSGDSSLPARQDLFPRRFGGRGVPVVARHDLRRVRVRFVVRRHDLHADLVEHVLYLRAYRAQSEHAKMRLFGGHEKRVLNAEISKIRL